MKKNEGIIFNEILNSVAHIPKAEPRRELYLKIEADLFNPSAKIIPLKKLSWIAAAAVLLISFNVTSLSNYSRSSNTSEQQVSQAYNYMINFNYYK